MRIIISLVLGVSLAVVLNYLEPDVNADVNVNAYVCDDGDVKYVAGNFNLEEVCK